MNKIFSLVLFLIMAVIGFLGYIFVDTGKETVSLANRKINFILNEDIVGTPTVLIDDIPAVVDGNILTPISLTTLRPVTVSVNGQTKKIELTQLAQESVIKINLIYKGKKKTYYLPTLPLFFPKLQVEKQSNSVKGGYVLISFHGLMLQHPSYSIIMDMNGKIVYYRGNKNPSYSMFHLQKWELPDGKIRYSMHEQDKKSVNTSWVTGYHLILDEQFRLIDKVSILPTDKHDALLADEHDIIVLGDKHYIAIGYDEEKYENTDKIRVVHAVIQEQKDGKILFDWTSKNKPEFIDMCYEKCPQLQNENADYLHINAIAIDPKDGHLIVSSASTYSIFKLHRKTGEVLWILGGLKDEFNISKDDLFIRQHYPHVTSDGRLMMFDNGWSTLNDEKRKFYGMKRRFARVLSFSLDEKNKKVLNVDKKELGFVAPYMGNAQQLHDGNLFVGCGSSDECSAQLYDNNMNVLWILTAKQPYKMYRAYWVGTLH